MARSGIQVHRTVAVVLWSLILVQDSHANGRTQSNSELGPGLYLNPVFLVSRRRDCALAWSPPCQLWLDVGLGELQSWRTTVDDAAHRTAM